LPKNVGRRRFLQNIDKNPFCLLRGQLTIRAAPRPDLKNTLPRKRRHRLGYPPGNGTLTISTLRNRRQADFKLVNGQTRASGGQKRAFMGGLRNAFSGEIEAFRGGTVFILGRLGKFFKFI
jgi:hypothetical protein